MLEYFEVKRICNLNFHEGAVFSQFKLSFLGLTLDR